MFLYYISSIMFMLFSKLFLIISMFMLLNKITYFLDWNVIILNSININMFIYMDWVMMMFIFTVLLISSMIMLYCCEYMGHDTNNIRFFFLVFMFIMSMLLMIVSPNMISILIGWDGLGLISYCLVIYYQNVNSFNSGMLTILLNRIGDVTMLMGISMMLIMGDWNFMFNNVMFNVMFVVMVMISAFTKSAQYPFSSWLPAAMAAPTPVSSLVHSSTLVTAGVYLLIRFHYLIYKNNMILNIIILVSLITMMMAGFSANFEFDMKKIIAFSTLSQLGLMMLVFAYKNWELSFFHLVIHAMFKSMMFMCSGILIHNMLNYQDIRFIGKFKYYMPMTFSTLMISNLSLCGMPFMSGFFSKDQILEVMLMGYNNLMIYIFIMISTGLTVSYSMRMIYYLMYKFLNFISMNNIKENKLMNYSMIILMVMSIFYGYLMNFFMFNNIENVYLNFMEKFSIVSICVIFIIINKFINKIKDFKFVYYVKYFFGKMWFLYQFIPMIIIFPMNFTKMYLINYDKGWSEMFFKESIMMKMNKLNNLDKMIYNNNNLVLMMFSIVFLMLIMVMLM
uniref:NADH dehydrogenase subunit 5 n=1 Tax=Trichomalopsis sarcophagae TaxID=543379 RepID=UPI00218249D5|nr:NADH dehydrogenase subunit 5 [Trichomalopsis sarcophagae]UVN15280.1 NADH dehydrogenase subunit 5 [Trichomalopsis sarcophagae]